MARKDDGVVEIIKNKELLVIVWKRGKVRGYGIEKYHLTSPCSHEYVGKQEKDFWPMQKVSWLQHGQDFRKKLSYSLSQGNLVQKVQKTHTNNQGHNHTEQIPNGEDPASKLLWWQKHSKRTGAQKHGQDFKNNVREYTEDSCQ